jgi:hypothetical protein
METVAARVALRVDPTPLVPRAPSPDAPGALVVRGRYRLTEEGRKASLLNGGDGRAMQEVAVSVPGNRLHLVHVDANGVARLKLEPFYTRTADRVVRAPTPPAYDQPPSLEQLLRDTAQNYELERLYRAERETARALRRERGRDERAQLAQAFLIDVTQRAVPHPAPTPKRCLLTVGHRRLLFDVTLDDGVAAQVPPEAHRRFREDLRARAERGRQLRAAQTVVHQQKQQWIAQWISEHGTEDQRARHAAGLLPIDEAIGAITDQAFDPLTAYPVLRRDGPQRLQAALRQLPRFSDVVITPADLSVERAQATSATAAQWALMQEIQRQLPDAVVTLRVHRLGWKGDRQAPGVTCFGILVVQSWGPLKLRREYEVPGASDS